MKKTKILLFISLIILSISFSTESTFAIFGADKDSNFVSQTLSIVSDALIAGIMKFIMMAIGVIIGFMAGLLTFGILLFTYLIDLIFIKVPYIGDILGGQGDMIFVKNVQMITTIVLIFSVGLWLILGGINYIKSVFDQITVGLQSGNKFNIFRDLFGKFLVVLLIFSIPFSLPSIFKGVNTISSGLLKLEINGFSREDQIVIAAKPLTSLVELGIGLPAVDGLSSDQEENKGKEFTSIHNRADGNGIVNGKLQFTEIFSNIIDKSLFQYGRFSNLADNIGDKEGMKNIQENSSTGVTEGFENIRKGQTSGFVKFLFISIFYIVMLYTIFMKLFGLFMALVTRFVNVIVSSLVLTFNIAMLGSENTKGFGARNLWSFIGDIIVTPVIAVFIGLCLIILGYFTSVLGVGDDSFLYFATGSEIDGYETVLFTGILVLAILYGMINKLSKTVEYIGANFENIISSNGGQGMQDSYASPGDALNASNKVWGMGKSIGSYLGFAKAGSMVGSNFKSSLNNMMNGDPLVGKVKDDAKYDGTREAHNELYNQIKSDTINKYTGKENNTKINN